MAENTEKRNDAATLFDPLVQTERIAFEQAEMLACTGCGRLNPPNRLKCIYCAKDLEIPVQKAGSVVLSLRKLEVWERGFNIIFDGKSVSTAVDMAVVAKLLSLQPSDVETILDANVSLPLARVESLHESLLVSTRLLELGISSTVVSDEDLAADKPPVRLSRIDFLESRLAFKAFNTGTVTEFDWRDLVLIVPGAVFTGRVDSVEKKGRHGKTTLLDETETTGDELILDLYNRFDSVGFRVYLTGFDFSCLGEDKGLLAGENLRRLVAKLRRHAANGVFADKYAEVKLALEPVWEIETRKDTKGLQHSGFGKREFGNVSSRTNLNQFTKFSRLQWQMYERDQKEKRQA